VDICWRQPRAIAAVQPVGTTLRLWIGGDARFTRLSTMDWLMNFLSPRAMLVIWVDAQKPAANDSLRASVTKRGFVVVRGTVHECGCALLARRSQDYPVQKAA
jgi:hypothetical protein